MAVEKVLIVVAMEAEAKPFVDHLGLEPSEGFFPSNTPFVAFQGKHKGKIVYVVTNGKDNVYETGVDNVGTVPASLVSYLALSSSEGPFDVLINAGTCGGFSKASSKAAIGDVYLTTAVANHDRRIAIPGFIEYGVGRLESTFGEVSAMASALGYKTGVCTTGNSLDKTDTDMEIMTTKNEASVKDMEAAAIAWSCKLHNTPFVGVKVVTDIVDGDVPSHEEFMQNLQAASMSLQKALPQVLDYIVGETKDEL